jgi:hypothetical protein
MILSMHVAQLVNRGPVPRGIRHKIKSEGEIFPYGDPVLFLSYD